ncbi:MAG TPA: DUF2711 family protein [Devosiaceae bacterium]|jgi:hypothetical protein
MDIVIRHLLVGWRLSSEVIEMAEVKAVHDERYLQYPPGEERYLDWFGERYAGVFIALNPFFKIDGLYPDNCAWETLIVDNRSGQDATAYPQALLETTGEVDPEDQLEAMEAVVRERATSITWRQICADAGFAGIPELNRALLSHIMALNRRFEDIKGRDRLREFCGRRAIFKPKEGNYHPPMTSRIIELFRSAGLTEVTKRDELLGDCESVSLDHLFHPDYPTSGRQIFAADHSLLTVIHWDSFFTLICVAEERLDTVDLSGFEGFWAQADTDHNWWLKPPPRVA